MSLTQGALLTICQGGTVLNPVLQVKIYIEFFVDRNVEIEPSCTFVLTTFNTTYSGPGSWIRDVKKFLLVHLHVKLIVGKIINYNFTKKSWKES